MRDEQFDEKLKDVLKDKTKNCSMSEEKRRAVLDQIHQVNKEEKTMKHVSKKKLVIAVATMCLMASMVVVAAGRIAYYTSSTNTSNPTYTSFADIKKAKKDLGGSVRAVEKFDNGVNFSEGYINVVNGLDDNNNQVSSYNQMALNYIQGNQRASLYINKEMQDENAKASLLTENVEGKILNYYEDQYLMLPPEEKPSEEDLALQEAGKLYISYGSSKVERLNCHYVIWSEEGMHYQLLSWDYSGQELMEMAKEIASADFVE